MRGAFRKILKKAKYAPWFHVSPFGHVGQLLFTPSNVFSKLSNYIFWKRKTFKILKF